MVSTQNKERINNMRMGMKKTVLALLLTLVLMGSSAIILISGISAEDAPSNEYSSSITSAPTVSSTGGVTPSVAYGACGPIDLVIALDDTGSMWGAIGNIKTELPTIISTATTASGGDLRVGYITFKDNVVVRNNLTTNISAVMNSINGTVAGGGAGAPEASDEAKNTFVNNLPAGVRADSAGNLGTQIGNFTTPPLITNVSATSITNNSATITWDTDEISDSLVKYGTESGNYTLLASNASLVLEHSIDLTGLLENTTYYYVVNSTDPSGNSNESLEYNFTTLVTVGDAKAQSCVEAPPDLVSWWPGDGDANDIIDGNDGTLQNGVTFAAGQVGQAFSLDGIDDFVDLGNASNLHVSAGDFTVDAWVFFNTLRHPPGENI
ncbi:MAG: fibronectin type III domain-containing protein, partial [Methanosarcinales archaeon]